MGMLQRVSCEDSLFPFVVFLQIDMWPKFGKYKLIKQEPDAEPDLPIVHNVCVFMYKVHI